MKELRIDVVAISNSVRYIRFMLNFILKKIQKTVLTLYRIGWMMMLVMKKMKMDRY